MAMINRFAFIFGAINVVLGILSMFRPFVRHPPRRGIARLLPRRDHVGVFNKGTGQLLGVMGAVNPPHAVMHTTLGAAGLATRRFPNLAKPYIWLTALYMLALAGLGWATVGMKPGNHNVMGLAMDRTDNIIHTLWGAGALALALMPILNSGRMNQREAMRMVEVGLSE